ncbi:MAG TPA: hypothetical protein VIL74_22065 [Pyrinomonadaceae bacterium]|jgi:hypothetical protein
MRKFPFLTAILLICLSVVSTFAQNANVKPSVVTGEVASISAEKMVLKTAGGDVEAALSGATKYMRVPPETPKLSAAVAATFADISVGDKVAVTGILADDKKSIPAKAVYLMSKAAIAERQSNYLEDWKKRGTNGRVVGYNPQTSVITIATRSSGVEKNISVKPGANTEFYRYAPDSTEFSKAVKSQLADIEPNDEIRVLGNKNADGSEVEAEKIVTGAFVQRGGKIKAIDIEKKEVVITDSQTNKDVAVVLNDNSVLKQFPAELAQRFSGAGGGQGGFRPATQGGGQPTPQPAAQQNSGQTPGGPGQGGLRQGGGGIDDSRFQNIKLSDLKIGEAVGILVSKKSDPSRVTAVKLFTGVEPFLNRPQPGGGGGRQGGGGGASLNIPGLDGFGGN